MLCKPTCKYQFFYSWVKRWTRLISLIVIVYFLGYFGIPFPRKLEAVHRNSGLLRPSLANQVTKLSNNPDAIQGHERVWPPQRLAEHVDAETGLYDLSIRPIVLRSSTHTSSTDGYCKILKTLSSNTTKPGSTLKQLYTMDQKLRLGSQFPYYDLYPQFIDIREAVRAVKSGLPIPEPPINNPKLLVSKFPKSACKSSEHELISSKLYPFDLVILVKSCVDCSKQRARCRNTYMKRHLWGNFRVQFVFVVGQPMVDRRKIITIRGVELRLKPIETEQERTEQLHRLMDESAKHEDLLIGSFRDTYYNLTLKMMFTFRWASLFCRSQSRLFMFIDDDQTIIPEHLIRLIRSLPTDVQIYFNGATPYSDGRVRRPNPKVKRSRYAVSLDEFPWDNYPPYSSGAAYMMGENILLDVSIAMSFTQFLRIDDAYLGIVMRKLNFPSIRLPGFALVVRSVKEFQQTLVGSSKDVDKYIDWNTGKLRSPILLNSTRH